MLRCYGPSLWGFMKKQRLCKDPCVLNLESVEATPLLTGTTISGHPGLETGMINNRAVSLR